MSEPQLERSVLEAKEREELFAIASALGTRPTSRARKSELVSQILRATGVEVATPEVATPQAPKRTRARKDDAERAEAAPPAADDAPSEEEQAPEAPAAERDEGAAAAPVAASNGHAPAVVEAAAARA